MILGRAKSSFALMLVVLLFAVGLFLLLKEDNEKKDLSSGETQVKAEFINNGAEPTWSE